MWLARRRSMLLALAVALSGCVTQPVYRPSGAYVQSSYVSAKPAQPYGPAECDDYLGRSRKDTDLLALEARLKSLGLRKGEFETTDQNRARVEAELPKIASLVNPDGLPFVAATAKIPLVKYDADAQTLKIEGMSVFNELVDLEYGFDLTGAGSFMLFTTRSSRQGAGTYIGQNAFGVTREVARIVGVDQGLAFNGNRSAHDWNKARSPIYISMDPETAARAKPHVGLLVLGELEAPYFHEGIGGTTPKISNPVDRTIQRRFVVVKPRCAAIIDTGDRHVWKRLL